MDVDERLDRERKGGASEEYACSARKGSREQYGQSSSFGLQVAPATNSTSLAISESRPSVLPENYDSVGELKQGQLGKMYKAKKASNGETVAVRMMPRIDAVNPLVATRFKDRCATLARLAHPAIVVPKDFGINQSNGALFGHAVCGRGDAATVAGCGRGA